MGCCSSRDLNDDSMASERKSDHLAIELKRMTQVPDMDWASGSDTVVYARLLNADRTDTKHHVHWPVMEDMNDPVWNKVRVFQSKFTSEQILALRFMDQDLTREESIGSLEIHLSELQDYKEHSFDYHLSRKASKVDRRSRSASALKGAGDLPPCQVVLRMVRIPHAAEGLKKTVFFIRHGESKWNEAQAKHNVGDMLKEYDHGLSSTGRDQAEALAASTVAEEYAEDPDAIKFMKAGVIYSSPLTRAIQTGMIGLQHHPRMKQAGVVLLRDAREVKKPGGFDTCGMVKGGQICERVEAETRKLYAANNAAASKRPMPAVPALDPNDAMNHWWTSPQNADSKQSVHGRQQDLLTRIMLTDAQTIVVVGHSLYFRKLFDHYASKSSKEGKNGLFCKQMGKCKMQNCAMIKCEVDFTDGLDGCIVDAKAMFGSGLMQKGQFDNEGSADSEGEIPTSPGDVEVKFDIV